MPLHMKGLLIGGLVPAILFGCAGLLQKVYGKTEGGNGPYLLFIGLGVLLCGGVVTILEGNRAVSLGSGMSATLIGVFWAAGMMFVLMGLFKFGVSLAQLAPLYNMNTLIVTMLALVVFAENRDVVVVKLLAGTLLIVLGGTLVARAGS